MKGFKNIEFVPMTFFITTDSVMVGKKKFRKTSGTMEEFYFLIFIIDLNSPNTGKEEEAGSGSGGHYHGSLKADDLMI
jgi:hypothetical protein